MYNQWQKNRFIEQYTNNVSYRDMCRNTFEMFEKYEVEWGADLCTRTSEELTPVIEDICGVRSKSIESRLVVLNEYVKWCQQEGISNTRADFSKIKPSGIRAMKRMTVSSPRHLQFFLDSVFEPIEMETIDVVYRCIFWLAFSGIPDSEILNIRNSDININGMYIRCLGRNYPIYREGLEAFKKVVHMTEFRVITDNRESYRSRTAGDLILRLTKESTNLKYLRNKIALKQRKIRDKKPELFSEDFPSLSYSSARLSGLFYEAFENERVGIPPDFSQFVYENRRTDISKMDDKQKRVQKRSEDFLARGFLEDYQRWKVAHYY